MPVYRSFVLVPPDSFQPCNTPPLADFCGLHSAQMHQLLYHSLELGSVMQLRAGVPDDVLE